MLKLSPALLTTIAARHGIVTADELPTEGIGHWAVRNLVHHRSATRRSSSSRRRSSATTARRSPRES